MKTDLTRPVASRRALLLGVAALAMSGARSVAGAADAAEAYVKQIAGEVMALANSGGSGDALRARFSALLNRYINLRGIADYALGQYRSAIPADKQGEFYKLVSNYASALFVYYVSDFRGSALDILSDTTQGKYTVIQSAIKGGGGQVRWRLLPSGGSFRVSDVNIRGVWLTIAMKDRFTKVMTKSKGDYKALFEELRQAETW